MGVKLVNASRGITGTGVKKTDNGLTMPRSIYQKLGSLVKNKTLINDYAQGDLNKEYIEFLDKMSSIEDGEEEMIEVDKYLGSLGLDEEYPYSKDYRGIPAWIEVLGQAPYRNVAIVENKATINNIVYNDGTTIQNVVHNTGEE